ncbi:MAG TPA: hypothetical protein PK408_10835 [Treponemataceae bacterium]|nr:hypothetical protein [Treponemataceae bacterium]
MKRVIATAALVVLAAAFVFAGGNKDTGAAKQLVVGANIYSFADNFMNGVMKPEF